MHAYISVGNPVGYPGIARTPRSPKPPISAPAVAHLNPSVYDDRGGDVV